MLQSSVKPLCVSGVYLYNILEKTIRGKMFMLNLIYLFAAVVLFKVFTNLNKYYKCKRYLSKYQEYIENPNWEFDEYKVEMVKLLQEAGIQDSYVGHVAPMGFGMVQTANMSVFSYLSGRREDIISLVTMKFHQAIGVYRSRLWEALSPFYWIETLVYLPRSVLRYLGVSADNIGAKLLTVVYWISSAAFVFYRTDLKAFLEEIYKQVFT